MGTVLARIALLVFVAWIGLSCVSTDQESGTGSDAGKGRGEKGSEETFRTDQPEFPSEKDDSFFKEDVIPQEIFRVLISKNNYSVRQLAQKDMIRRKPDPNGDREQLSNYRQFNDRYDFKDINLRAVLSVRINPHNGEIEHAEYVPGKNPRSWQASRFFQDDLSRFSFTFPRNAVLTREFWITFEWRIRRREGMTDAEAKERAVQFLKQQLD